MYILVQADAGECYIELVQLFGRLLPNDETRDRLVRNIFDLVQVDRVVCSHCDYDSQQPATSLNTMLLYVSRLVETAQVLGEKPLDDLIGALNQQDAINCPKCSKPHAVITKEIKSLPEVFSLSTVWPSSRPSRSLLNDFLNTISTQIDLQSIGAVDMKLKKTANTNYHLRGMILYYGRHYTACFYHASVGRWLRFDDSRVDPIGRYWHEVTDFCVRSRFQPSVLFYERETPGQTYYESVPQDVIPRSLPIMESPQRSKAREPSLHCPRLEGPVYRKIKKNWHLSWFKLSEFCVTLYSRAQKTFAPQYGGWVQSRRDPPTLLLPVDTIKTIEQDKSSHNFNRKPHYLKIVAQSDDASSQDPLEILLFVEGPEPFAQILSALIQAKDVINKANKGSARRQRSVIIDNAQLGFGMENGKDEHNPDANALDFAPNASIEDLRRIAEMESGTPREEGSDEETPTTVIGSPVPSHTASPTFATTPAVNPMQNYPPYPQQMSRGAYNPGY